MQANIVYAATSENSPSINLHDRYIDTKHEPSKSLTIAHTKLSLQELSKQRQWEKLLHIENGHTEIENAEFFISSHLLKEDFALTELQLSLDLIRENPIHNNGFSFRCRYPARVHFLAKYGYTKPITPEECPQVFEWLGGEDFGISLIYADGYLGNPASFYGHLIFKFDSDDPRQDLLSNSLNFGATVPDNENPVVYILKGLFGGYSAKYTSNFFFRHSINYTEVELRDLWKYKLILNDYQRFLLAFHTWELMQTEYTYYFTHRNCAYHVGKSLELISDQDLINSQQPFVLPVSIFKSVSNATANNLAMISNIEYLPSRQTRMREEISKLQINQQKILNTIINDLLTRAKIQQLLSELTTEEQIAVLDAAYAYIEFAYTQADDEEKQDLLSKKRNIQRIRIGLPVSKNVAKKKISKPELPHDGHKPSLIRVTYGSADNNAYTEITFRPAYYDLHSSGGGILKNSALTMGKVSVRNINEDMELSGIDLLHIETYPTGGTGLPFDKDLAWKLRVGSERNYIDGVDNSLEWFVDSGIGKAAKFGDATVVYGMLNGRLQTPDDRSSRLFAIPTVGFLSEFAGTRGGCEIAYQLSIASQQNTQKRRISCGVSVIQKNTWDLRATYNAYYEDSFGLGLSWYW